MLAHHVTILSAEAFLDSTSHIHSSQDSNPTAPVQPPSHARRWRNGNSKYCLLGINFVSVFCDRICILCGLISIIKF
jgi:hypothetical protein